MQHFLLSRKARTLSLSRVARLSDEEAFETFKQVRWSATNGDPVCPRCGSVAVYTYRARKLFKCIGCTHQFSVTSGSIFASRKLPIRTYLLAQARWSGHYLRGDGSPVAGGRIPALVAQDC